MQDGTPSRLADILGFLKKKLIRSRWSSVTVGGIAFLLIAAAGVSSVYERFELNLYDVRFKVRPAPDVWQKLVLLDIDDSSIVNVGEFPWPRNIYAQGLSVLKSAGCRNFLFDIQFMDKSPRFVDRDAMASLMEKAKKHALVSPEEVDAAAVDNDAVLARGIQSFPGTIVPFSFEKQILYTDDGSEAARSRNESLKLFMQKATVPVPSGKEKLFSACLDPSRKAVHPPIPPLVEAGGLFGYVDSDPEVDGYIRKTRLVRVFDGRIYFHMALVALGELTGVPVGRMVIEPGRKIVIPQAMNPVTMVRRDIVIPVDESCSIYINWAGTYEKSFSHLPYFALLEYEAVKDDIHSWLAETERDSGTTERSELIATRTMLRQKMVSAKNDKDPSALHRELTAVSAKITAIEDGYVRSIERQRDELSAAAQTDSSKKKDLAEAENMLTAIHITRGVDALRDSVCISGYTANASQDVGSTPLTTGYYLVGSYPNIINTVLGQNFIHRLPRPIELSIMLIFAIGIAYFVLKQNAKRALILSVVAVAAYNVANVLLFVFADLWVDQLGVSLCLIVPSFVIIGVKFLSEESQRKFIKDVFSKYLAKQVVDELIKDPKKIKLGGEEQEVTIFFSDIQSFTSMSEKMMPSDLVNFLNDYLSDMTGIILENRGTVDKFIGDAIMAFYGAPYHFDDHAMAACTAAVSMQAHLRQLREKWKRENRLPIYSRFGINTGTAVVGNMGSRERISYTAMGDTVNLASRLEGANKYYGTYTMISESTQSIVKNDFETRYLDRIRVVGKEQPIGVYELVSKKGGLDLQQQELFEIYAKGIDHFSKQEWEKSRKIFAQALKLDKNDGPSKTYHDRCAEFIAKPPSKKWDGVYTMKSK